MLKSFDLTPETDRFLAEACKIHNENNKQLNAKWEFNKIRQWGYEQETGILKIILKDQSIIEANGQIFGTWSKDDLTWEWAWNSPYADKKCQIDSLRAKKYGIKNHIEYLHVGIIPAPVITIAAYLAAICEKINNAQGVYPGNTGPIVVFIGIHDLKRIK